MMVDESEFGLFLDVLVDKIKDQLKYYRTYSAKVKIVADVMSDIAACHWVPLKTAT